jgi:hypothetical protein
MIMDVLALLLSTVGASVSKIFEYLVLFVT